MPVAQRSSNWSGWNVVFLQHDRKGTLLKEPLASIRVLDLYLGAVPQVGRSGNPKVAAIESSDTQLLLVSVSDKCDRLLEIEVVK